MTVKAVVFDIGNVLIEWHPERLFDSVIGPEARTRLFAEVPLHDMNAALDLGGPFKDTVYALAEEHPAWGDEVRMWYDRFPDMLEPVLDHSVRLLRALKAKGVPVFALSNFGRDSYAAERARRTFLQEFDQEFISGREGVMKPDTAFYEMLEKGTGLSGPDLLFADDREDNIEAAQARGWLAHLFIEPQGWADRLVAEGLLTPEEAK